MKKTKDKPTKSLEHLAPQVRINSKQLTDEEKKHRNYHIYIKPNFTLILTLMMEGYTQEQIMNYLGIGKASWYKYRKEIPEFNEFILLGRMRLMNRIEQSAYDLALGQATSRTVKTKEVYNPDTGEFEPEERQVEVKQDKASEKMIQYVLGRLSQKWKGSDEQDNNEDNKVIQSISALIDTLMETNDEPFEETTQDDQKGGQIQEGNGDSTGADSADEMDF